MGFAALSLQIFLLLCGATGCVRERAKGHPTSAVAKGTTAPEKHDIVKSDKTGGKVADLMDAQKAARAVAVLRVKFVAALGGNKYAWDRVEVLEVMKNDSGHKFVGVIDIAHYSWEPGIPEGECIIYIVPYSPTGLDLWKLLDGTGKQGVGPGK